MIQLITVKELSSILKVKEKTLYQWASLDQIPHIKINGSLRFSLPDIETWISASKKDPVAGYNPVAKLEAPKGGIRAT